MRAETTGENAPGPPGAVEDEDRRSARGRRPPAAAVAGRRVRRRAEAAPAAGRRNLPARAGGERVLRRGRDPAPARPSRPATQAVLPLRRRAEPVDLWFVDLARKSAASTRRAGAPRSPRSRPEASGGRELRQGRVVGDLQAAPARAGGVVTSRRAVRARSPSRSGTAPSASAATSAASRWEYLYVERREARRPSARWSDRARRARPRARVHRLGAAADGARGDGNRRVADGSRRPV